MAASNFDTCLGWILKEEGGNDDDPQDHGGRTSRGITQREYDAWSRIHGKPGGDVWYATDADVKEIYLSQYWNPYCETMPAGLDYLFFDISVNAGRTQAVRTFQKALGVHVDGMLGQVTWAGILNAPDTGRLIRSISEYRRNFYRSLRQFPRYGRGWLGRVDRSEAKALKMAEATPPLEDNTLPSTPKANDQDHNTPSVSPETSGSVAAGSGGLIGMLHSLQDSLYQYKDTIKYVSYALLAIAVVSFGYAAYGYMKRSKAQQAM